MQIEEVIKIYDFLGNLDFLGFIALCILLSIGILAVFIPLKEKKLISQKFIIIILCLINGALLMLYNRAKCKIEDLHQANFIKQDFITSNFKQKSFRNVSLPKSQDTSKITESLIDLADKFPDEFLLVKLSVLKNSSRKSSGKKDTMVASNNPLDVNAIALIDTKARDLIDKQISEKANRTSHLLATILNTPATDTIFIYKDCNYPDHKILANIDNPGWLIGIDFFNALIGRNDLKPFYKDNYIAGFTLAKATNRPAVTTPRGGR